MQRFDDYFEQPQAAKRVRYLFYVSLVLLVVLEFLFDQHRYFPWAVFPAFFAIYGFFSCVIIVAASKLLGKFWLQKGEDYYD